MRKLSLTMTAIAVMGLMTMVSCRKPVNGVVKPGETRTVTFTATTENGNGSKTSISDHDILWKSGDVISVNGEPIEITGGIGTKSGTFSAEITAKAPYYIGYPEDKTTFTSPSTLKLGIPSTQTYDADNVVVPMAAYSTTDGNISFKNAVNVLKLQLKGDGTPASKLTYIVLNHASANLSGDITVTIDGGKPTFGYANGSKTATVDFGEGLQLESGTTPVYIVLPKIASGDIKITFFCANGMCMEETLTYQLGFNTENNLISNETPLSVEADKTTSFLPCDFTVSAGEDGVSGTADDVKVKFSKGNLYWDGTAEEGKRWKFEANQWNFQSSYSSTWADNNHISHFYWCKSSAEAVKLDYEETGTTTSDVFFTNDPGFTVEGQTVWRTLSRDEWNYLLGFDPGKGSQTDEYGRANAMYLCKFVKLTVESKGDVYGLVILPDGSDPTLLDGYDDGNPISEAFLSSNGAVFLPAAGYRDDTDMDGVGSHGIYWSSTPCDSSHAYFMLFASGFVYAADGDRDNGLCVRLVR